MRSFLAQNGAHFILTFVETYSRFVIICPVKDHTEAQALLDHVFPNYSLSLSLHSDNVPEFTGQVWDNLLTLRHPTPSPTSQKAKLYAKVATAQSLTRSGSACHNGCP